MIKGLAIYLYVLSLTVIAAFGFIATGETPEPLRAQQFLFILCLINMTCFTIVVDAAMGKDAPLYYVHTIVGLCGRTQGHFGGYRWRWVAYLKLRRELIKFPYGEGVITRSPDHPKISK